MKYKIKIRYLLFSYIVSCFVLLVGFQIAVSSQQEYYDIIFREVAEWNANKTGEIKTMWTAMFLGGICAVLLLILRNKKGKQCEREEINGAKYIKNILNIGEIYLAVFLIPNICFWLLTGNLIISLFIVSIIGGFIWALQKLYQEKHSLEELEQDIKQLTVFVFILYYFLLSICLVLSRIWDVSFTSRSIIGSAIIFSFIIWKEVKKRKQENILYKMLFVFQVFIPIFLFSFYKNKYYYKGEIMTINPPLRFSIQIIGIIILLMILAFIEGKKLLKDKSSIIKKGNFILYSTIITIYIINITIGEASFVYSGDFWHTGEELLPWHQIMELGLKPYKEYSSAAGLFPMFFGFINEVLLKGSAMTYNFAWVLQFIYIAIITISCITCNVGKEMGLYIAIFSCYPNYNRVFFILPILFILSNQKIIKNSIRWILLWVVSILLAGLYYPIYGVALGVCTLPFGIFQGIELFKKLKKKEINKKIVIFSTVLLLGIVLSSLPLLLRMVSHILRMSKQSVLADGIVLMEKAQPFSWFLEALSGYPQLWQTLYCVFEASIPCLIFIIFVSLLSIYILNNRKNKKMFTEPIFLLLCAGTIGLTITYTFGFIRLDTNWFLARAGVVIILFTGVVLPIILLKYKMEGVEKKSIFYILAISILCTNLIRENNTGHEINKINNMVTVPENYSYAEGEALGLEKLGTGFIEQYSLSLLHSLKQERELFLKEGEKVFHLDGTQGCYYIFNQATPVPDAPIYAMTDKNTQTHNIKALQKEMPNVVQFAAISVREYYIYYWLIEQGYILHEQGGFQYFIHPQRYQEVMDDYEIVKNEMINKYDVNRYINRDLQHAPTAWGNSIKTLKKNFEEYSGAEINVVSYDGKIENLSDNIIKYHLKERENTNLEIEFSQEVYGQNADFLYLDLEMDTETQIIIYFENMGEYKETHSFICNLQNGKALIPLGGHPGWLLNNNTKIQISFVPTKGEFQIQNIQLLKLKQ